MSMSVQEAEKEREDLIARYIKDKAYTGFDSEADGVNHLAFITRDMDKTIEFYTQVIRLKMLRVRAMDNDPQSTQVFFDMGRGELLAFLRLNNVNEAAKVGLGGYHHGALTVTREQYGAVGKTAQREEHRLLHDLSRDPGHDYFDRPERDHARALGLEHRPQRRPDVVFDLRGLRDRRG